VQLQLSVFLNISLQWSYRKPHEKLLGSWKAIDLIV
jgi:hypothetical protein